MLDNRLRTVAEMVRQGSRVADIGTDHAHLPVWLVQNGKCPFAIASDIVPGPVAAATNTVTQAGESERVSVRLGDGLSTVSPNEVDDIVIAGMGGETIAAILQAAPWVQDSHYQLILQPMTRAEVLRRYLWDTGFDILTETPVREGKHWYTVLCVGYTGKVQHFSEAAYYIGRLRLPESEPYLAVVERRLQKQQVGCPTQEIKQCLEQLRLARETAKGLALASPPKRGGNHKMTIRDLLAALQEKAPFETAEEWDNTGLAVGSETMPMTKAVVALDATEEALQVAIAVGADVIITHHPLLFEPLKTLSAESLPYRLAAAGIAAVSVHTNLDKAVGGVNDCLAEQLELQDVTISPDGMSRIGTLPEELSPSAFTDYVAEHLNASVRVKKGTSPIRTVALCGGAGAELVLPLLETADAAVTGELKHHEWLAVPADKTMVDGGHYATEVVVLPRLCKWLCEAFPNVSVVPFYGEAPYITKG